MSAASLMRAGREFVEQLMVSTCLIERATGETTSNPVTLEETPVYATIYAGPCRVKLTDARPVIGQIPGTYTTKQPAALALPIGALGSADVAIDDRVTVITNPLDPAVVGAGGRIAGLNRQTLATARRFYIELAA